MPQKFTGGSEYEDNHASNKIDVMNYFNQLEIEKEEEEVLKQQIMERIQSMMGGNLYVR